MAISHEHVSASRPSEGPPAVAEPTISRPIGPAVAGCIVGAGAVASGFPPFNNVTAQLHVSQLPGFALLTPVSLVAALAVYCVLRPAGAGWTALVRDVPRPALATIGLIVVGAFLSLLESSNRSSSQALIILAVLAPAALFLAVRRGALPLAAVAGSFLVALVVLLLRADVVFLHQWGFPTQSVLFSAKFSNRPYDFHYYTLGNPDHTATFLLLPFALALGWSLTPGQDRRLSWALRAAAGVIYLTMILTYGRFPLLLATVLLLVAVAVSKLPRALRIGIVTVAIAGAVTAAIVSPGHYLAHVFSTNSSSSGGVRVSSLSSGLTMFSNKPLTGDGIGRYGLGVTPPAHSSIVQAAAEMGIAGLLGVALLTVGLVGAAVLLIRRRAGFSLKTSALGASAVYAIATAVAGPGEGLFVGLVSVYGVSLALIAGIGLSASDTDAAWPWTGEAFKTQLGRAAGAVGERMRTWNAGWLAYGVLWALIAALVERRHLPLVAYISSSRLADYDTLLQAYHHGVGPLVGMLTGGHLVPVGLTDDQGPYIVLPWLSSLLHHTDNMNAIVRSSVIASFCLTALGYPIAVRRLTGSRFAALLSAPLFILCFRYVFTDGFYWVPGLLVALCVPWLLILARERRAPWPPLVAIAILAGLSSIFRSQTGLGMLIAAVLVCGLAAGPRRRRLLSVALILVAYYAVSVGTLDVAFQARGDRMHGYPIAPHTEADFTSWYDGAGHPLWHTVYIGLGVVKNRYGITYNDSSAADYVASVDPHAVYVGATYESILRRRVLHLLWSDPGFIARAEWYKVRHLAGTSVSRFWPLLVMIPLLAWMAVVRRRWRELLVVVLPCAVFAALPPLLSVPEFDYEQPWLGLLAACEVLGGCALAMGLARTLLVADSPLARSTVGRPLSLVAARADARWTAARGRRDLLAERSGPALAALAAVVLLAGVVVVLALARSSPAGPSLPPQPGQPLGALPLNTVVLRPVTRWRFAHLPPGWSKDPPTQITTGRTLAVRTSVPGNAYQLQGPIVTLAPGNYVAIVKGAIVKGGMELGVLDVNPDVWLELNTFHASHPARAGTLLSAFSIVTREPVEVILAQAPDAKAPSRWRLIEGAIAHAYSTAPPARHGPRSILRRR